MDLAQISQVDNALLQACLEGNEDALAHAVRHGALATRARDAMGATPLHMACLGGHLPVVKLLCSEKKASASPHVLNYREETPLVLAQKAR